MAGQTTTFDLIILIALGVVLQSAALQDGAGNAVVFVLTVFALHRMTAMLCAHSRFVRHVVRGKPRPLVRDGHVIARALELEGITHAELLAGLRKLGYDRPDDVKLAVLEETGTHLCGGKRQNRRRVVTPASDGTGYALLRCADTPTFEFRTEAFRIWSRSAPGLARPLGRFGGRVAYLFAPADRSFASALSIERS